MDDDIILLSHGSGGESTKKLIEEEILKYLGNEILNELLDSAIFELKGKLAFTTDSFVVNPIFFNGGDIGKLAIYGTVNDLSVMGAKPLYLSIGFILEEGTTFEEFRKILNSIKIASEECGIKIVTGDTKVVEKGKGDKIFINTSGIGIIEDDLDWRKREIKEGDIVIINGEIGEHGLCIMLQRLGVKIGEEVKSDLAPLNSLILPLLKISPGIKFMRDPTRGGVAGVLNEIAQRYNVEIEIEEEKIPIKPWVKSASEILGIDPLYSANEGKVIIIADKKEEEKIIDFMKNHPLGKEAKVIGEVKGKGNRVYLKTRIGTRRIVDPLKKDLLPRIC